MKYYLLVCEALADEPAEALGQRTPLEVAKTPFMDELAKRGKVGIAAFVPSSLAPGPPAALFSMLGFDPREFYTGLAPLEALALGIPMSDQEVAFRCDLVTVADGKMIDPSAGHISSKEAFSLLKDLKEKIENKTQRIYHEEGHKNILIISDADQTDDLDDMECLPAQEILGQKIAAHLPKGKAQRRLLELMSASQAVLENHEVNRVRIDLKENPASQFWLWGQGRKPKTPSFKQRSGIEGGFFSEVNFVRGFGAAVGLERYAHAEALGSKPFSLFYKAASEILTKSKELKNRIKHIEEFDSKIVGPLLKKLTASKDGWRLAVTTERMRQHAPVLLAGTDIEAKNAAAFNEKICGQSGIFMESGTAFLKELLKTG